MVPSNCLCCLSTRQNIHINIAFAESVNRYCLLCIKARKLLGLIQSYLTIGFKIASYLVSRKKLTELGLGSKALLLLDNFTAHPYEDELMSSDGQIVAKFLPPNVTSLLQPMDQSVIECIKRIYHRSILKDLVSQTKDGMLGFLQKN